MTSSFPGDWNSAARLKISSGKLGEVLIAKYQGKVVGNPLTAQKSYISGYCQWEGEHFGPFGVCESVRNKGVGAKVKLFWGKFFKSASYSWRLLTRYNKPMVVQSGLTGQTLMQRDFIQDRACTPSENLPF